MNRLFKSGLRKGERRRNKEKERGKRDRRRRQKEETEEVDTAGRDILRRHDKKR